MRVCSRYSLRKFSIPDVSILFSVEKYPLFLKKFSSNNWSLRLRGPLRRRRLPRRGARRCRCRLRGLQPIGKTAELCGAEVRDRPLHGSDHAGLLKERARCVLLVHQALHSRPIRAVAPALVAALLRRCAHMDRRVANNARHRHAQQGLIFVGKKSNGHEVPGALETLSRNGYGTSMWKGSWTQTSSGNGLGNGLRG